MSSRATILPKSTQLPHKTVVLSKIKGILMTTRAAETRQAGRVFETPALEPLTVFPRIFNSNLFLEYHFQIEID